MRQQVRQRRDSKNFLLVDEDCGIPASLIEDHRVYTGSGPLAPSDPRSYLLSMSEYGDSKAYDVYDYSSTTRPDQGHHAYGGFAAPPTYPAKYVAPQAHLPSGLPQSSATLGLVSPAQQYGTHDPTNYYGQQMAQYPAYLETPRPLPDIIDFTPHHGQQGTKVTVYFQSLYDFDAPRVTPLIMFGQKRCESVLAKSVPNGHAFQYSLTAHAPAWTSTNSPSPIVPVALILEDGSVSWESPSVDLGEYTYLQEQAATYYQLDSPQLTAQSQMQAPRKRKLSPEASPRRSPIKKSSMQHLGSQQTVQGAPDSSFRRPSVPDAYQQSRRFSGQADYQQTYGTPLSRVSSQQYYDHARQPAPSVQLSPGPSWAYGQGQQPSSRSPSTTAIATASKSSQLLPSPTVNNPPLIRTSTLQQSPTNPGAAVTPASVAFNPYAIYPSNTKALLKLDGDLNTMADKWTAVEWEAKRRLVQFRRAQSGSVITAAFEPVTLEERVANSICVSCIWWEEKQECYVTSVDTISLLESLVAVRFTVEEKNRIRRNLEGFRPATVSKTKQESEDFFKLIMGFPVPKPRNIEKDVKVFPWRVLATALKKIIGKYSASYSSTAGALHTPMAASYSTRRPSDAGMEQRPIPSPRSASSSATSQGHAYAGPAMLPAGYPSATARIGVGPPVGPPDLHLSVPTSADASKAASWHQPPSTQYSSSDMASAGRTWDFGGYLNATPAAALPSPAEAYQQQYQQRIPSLTGPAAMPAEARFVALQDYESPSQATSNG